MLITEETQVINNEPFPPEVDIIFPAMSTMYSSTYLYMLCDHRAYMSPESCSKVLGTASKPCDNRDHINQGHVFFFVFHFDLTPFSGGQLSKVSARPTVFNWKNYCCLLYTSPSPRDGLLSRMPSSA